MMARPATMKGLAPMRSLMRPATGAMNMGMIVQGSTLRPASNGLSPCTVCRNCARKNTAPKSPKYRHTEAALATLSPRFRKKASGSMGCAARDSHHTKRRRNTAPPMREPRISTDPQPASLPRTMP